MRLNKKFIVLLAFVSLFLCIVTLQDTYAKYVSNANGTTDIAIARWRILINNFDVRNELTSSNLITPVFSGNANIASGVIAPTSTGYFDIVVDSTETDVSFTYNISVANDPDSIVEDIVITGCTLNGQPATFNNNAIAGTIYLTNPTKVNTIRVFVEWNDSTGQTMDNAADTAATIGENPAAQIAVTAHFIQAR